MLLTLIEMVMPWANIAAPFVDHSAGGGGPVQKVELVWEEMDDRLRLHAWFLMGPWAMDPQQIRLSIFAPDGAGVDLYWPEGDMIHRIGIGHYAVDLQPTQIGVWQGRWDSWGQHTVNAIRAFAFEIGVKEGIVNWKESTQRFGVMPKEPAVML